MCPQDATKNRWARSGAVPNLVVDNSGGAASNTVAAIGVAYSQVEVRNAIASLSAKVNALLAAARDAGDISN